MSIEKYNTFWKIIQKNRIDIPTIQRDYVYGRKSSAIIMRNLISDIENSLRKKTPVNLAFVFGKIFGEGNQESLEIKQNNHTNSKFTFIPLDGQQRLTTLFLIHWYIAQKNEDLESLKTLKYFSYSTRISSKDFCQMLCGKLLDLNISNDSVSEIICNNEDYFSFWSKDPTVKSMLVVIDEIQKKFNFHNSEYNNLWKLLTETDLIYFDFFNLDDFEQTDDLYIKMNARGIKLTNFEKFKSWLIEKYDKSSLIVDWRKNFDIKWCDLFWRAKEKTSYSIDTEFLQFFKILFLGDYMKSLNMETPGMEDDSDLDNFNSEDFNIDDFNSVIAILRKKDSNPLEIFKKLSLFDNNISRYLELLDLLYYIKPNTCLESNKYTSSNLLKLLIGEKLNSLTWWDTTFHYAVTNYIFRVKKNNSNLHQWVRILSNLIYNTTIDSPKLFVNAILSIDSLISKMNNDQSVYSIFSNLNENEISFFSPEQKKEEILKAKLIIQDSNWESIIIEAENHNYFYGQINFIFNLCESKSVNFDINPFKETFNKVSVLFSEDVLNDSERILTRSLLSLGDCFYNDSGNKVFNSNLRGTLRNRNENWRKFFNIHLNFIKKLIYHKDFNENNISDSLNKIIEVELPNIKEEYFSKFVENHKLFDYPKKNCIRPHEKNHYLLNSTRFSKYYVELYTYDWFLKIDEEYYLKNYDLEVSYAKINEGNNKPHLEFKRNKCVNQIERNQENGLFNLKQNGNLIEEFSTIQDAINKILKIDDAK